MYDYEDGLKPPKMHVIGQTRIPRPLQEEVEMPNIEGHQEKIKELEEKINELKPGVKQLRE